MKTILIADDDPGLRGLVAATLNSDEYIIVQAQDGAEALALMLEHRPAVAILDVRMPGRTGLEVTRAARAEPDLQGMHIILLTSGSGRRDLAAGLAAGADAYLTKPFSPLDLLNRVDKVVA